MVLYFTLGCHVCTVLEYVLSFCPGNSWNGSIVYIAEWTHGLSYDPMSNCKRTYLIIYHAAKNCSWSSPSLDTSLRYPTSGTSVHV
ncbi:hypothetical protein DFH27DRAFT_547693 [Peziza echinospora]|nr:hypothetical protein DFH27DRAFT_547693 [Peziza echinospora]